MFLDIPILLSLLNKWDFRRCMVMVFGFQKNKQKIYYCLWPRAWGRPKSAKVKSHSLQLERQWEKAEGPGWGRSQETRICRILHPTPFVSLRLIPNCKHCHKKGKIEPNKQLPTTATTKFLRVCCWFMALCIFTFSKCPNFRMCHCRLNIFTAQLLCFTSSYSFYSWILLTPILTPMCIYD